MDKKIITSGKRKSAVARAIIIEGKGDIRINHKNYKTLPFFSRLRIEEPIRIAKEVLGNTDFDVTVEVHGGGEKGQIEAVRLALARAIVEFSKSKELTETLDNYDRNLLVADVRRKEACKPGDSKARAMRQASKR